MNRKRRSFKQLLKQLPIRVIEDTGFRKTEYSLYLTIKEDNRWHLGYKSKDGYTHFNFECSRGNLLKAIADMLYEIERTKDNKQWTFNY